MTDEEVKDFVAINFSEYFKSIRDEQNLRKVAESIYIFLTTPGEAENYVQSNSYDHCLHKHNVEVLNLFDAELQLINIKPMIKNIPIIVRLIQVHAINIVFALKIRLFCIKLLIIPDF